MAGWSDHTGAAVVLPMENIDTDQLIPARFMSVSRSEGYADYLLHDMRRDASGGLIPEFPINAAPQASILITHRNFGTGSSREAAVYALVDFGIKAVIAPSFGDIFASNAVNNGLLPAQISEDNVAALITALDQAPAELSINLDTLEIAHRDSRMRFDLDPTWRTKLMNGWDDIDLTQSHADAIKTFGTERPNWTQPDA